MRSRLGTAYGLAWGCIKALRNGWLHFRCFYMAFIGWNIHFISASNQ